MSPTNYKERRVIVLGASGFIGRWVARALTDVGAELVLPVRDLLTARRTLEGYRISGTLHELDLRDEQAVAKLVSTVKPAIIFNLAGYGVDPQEREEHEAHQINAELVRTVCEAQSKNNDDSWTGQQLIHVGSALEYGEASNDLAEDSVAQPTTLYGRSKLAGTDFVRRFCGEGKLRALVARLFTVYGPGEHDGRLLPSLIEASKSGKSLELTAGLQERDFTFVGDVANGLLRLGLLDTVIPGDIVNLATGQLTSVRTFAETAAGILGLQPDKLKFGALPVRTVEMKHSAVNIERLQRFTSWRPSVAIGEGIRQTVEFNKQLASQKNNSKPDFAEVC